MGRIKMTALYLGYLGMLALGGYELTAKSPALLGRALPGWEATERAERITRWRRPTGWPLLDHLLHETQEAAAYYGLRGRGYPAAAAFSSRSDSRERYAS